MELSTKKKIAIIGGATLALGALWYFVFRKRSKGIEQLTVEEPVSWSSTPVSVNCNNYQHFPLKRGSGCASTPCSKDKVKQLQTALNNHPSRSLITPNLTVDGCFGSLTEMRLSSITGSDVVADAQELYEIKTA